MAHVMACCLTAPSHYLHQCWLLINEVQRIPLADSQNNFGAYMRNVLFSVLPADGLAPLSLQTSAGTAMTMFGPHIMKTSSNGNIFRVTGPLCGEFTGQRWISRTKASDAELWFFSLICAWMNGWVSNREAGDLRRQDAHYDVTVMYGTSHLKD